MAEDQQRKLQAAVQFPAGYMPRLCGRKSNDDHAIPMTVPQISTSILDAELHRAIAHRDMCEEMLRAGDHGGYLLGSLQGWADAMIEIQMIEEKMNILGDVYWKEKTHEPIDGIVVLAFLQNPWFKPRTSPITIALYRSSPRYRRAILRMSRTGQYLARAFGEEIYGKIWWDNSSPAHGYMREHKSPADAQHMRSVIELVKPDIILCFGRGAGDAMLGINPQCHVMMTAHPSARGDRMPELLEFAENVMRKIAEMSFNRHGEKIAK